jgi:septum formation protein
MAQLILASASPRRQDLLMQAGYSFQVQAADVDETPEASWPLKQIPQMLASRKGAAVVARAGQGVVLAADTEVVLEGQVMGKPASLSDARSMLQRLSGRQHEVITGIFLQAENWKVNFSIHTEVRFRTLEEQEIDYYLNQCQVLDKAGAYGIQDWIGLIGIVEINGDYHNVVGLPISVIKPYLDEAAIFPM